MTSVKFKKQKVIPLYPPLKKGRWGGFFLFLVFCFFASSVSAEPLKLTLEQALDKAMKANYDVKVAEENLSKLEATIGEARSGALPQLTGTGGYTRNIVLPEIFLNDMKFKIGFKNEYQAQATLNQPLYAAGKVWKAIRAAKTETNSKEATLKNVRHEIALLVKKTFYQILLADKTITITKKTLKQFTDQLDAIRTRYNQGIESDYTLMRQEVQVSNVTPELSAAEQIRLVLINSFKDVLALPKETEIELEDSFKFEKKEYPSEEGLIETALSNRQDIAAKREHIQSLKYNVGIERGGYLPTFGFTSNINFAAQSDDFGIGSKERTYAASVGLLLSVPIFDGLKTHYRIREAKSDLKIAATEETQLLESVKSEVLNARASLKEAVLREQSQKKTLNLAQKAVDIAGLRFSQGLTSQLELNDTILQRDQAEKLYAQAVFDCLTAEAVLLRVIGGEI